ncbi:MAG: hypothetical protein US98_C0032G0008 [Parcubacteria group bacterium GW2011_GWC1_38_6]|nr:MAG: hypothetical protein US98_C0032G0008 [Parcubacteria group bacterium GW2011_GWC1_38_6]
MIITKKLINEAIELAKPIVQAFLTAEGFTWGPKYVIGFVSTPWTGLIPFDFVAPGETKEWNPVWGEEKDFANIAMKKLELTLRIGKNTSVVTADTPWLIRDGEYLYPGGVTQEGISVAISGAKGRTDEALAEILISIIIMLANLEADGRKKAGEMQI